MHFLEKNDFLSFRKSTQVSRVSHVLLTCFINTVRWLWHYASKKSVFVRSRVYESAAQSGVGSRSSNLPGKILLFERSIHFVDNVSFSSLSLSFFLIVNVQTIKMMDFVSRLFGRMFVRWFKKLLINCNFCEIEI